VEKHRLANGRLASGLTITDEASGAILTAELSPQEQWQQVSPRWVQEVLRRTFTQWGLPRCLRVDNGHPWGSWSDLPRDLALWVIGLARVYRVFSRHKFTCSRLSLGCINASGTGLSPQKAQFV
jgi:hypothetical protein